MWMQPWGTRYVATFLRTHGQEVFPEIRAAYVDTMNKVVLLYCSCHLVYFGQSGAGAGSVWELKDQGKITTVRGFVAAFGFNRYPKSAHSALDS